MRTFIPWNIDNQPKPIPTDSIDDWSVNFDLNEYKCKIEDKFYYEFQLSHSQWIDISVFNKSLSETNISYFKDQLNLYSIINYRQLSENCIQDLCSKIYKNKSLITLLFKRQKLSYSTIKNLLSYDSLDRIRGYIRLTRDTFQNPLNYIFDCNEDELIWFALSSRSNIPKDILKKYKSQWTANLLCSNDNLNNDIITHVIYNNRYANNECLHICKESYFNYIFNNILAENDGGMLDIFINYFIRYYINRETNIISYKLQNKVPKNFLIKRDNDILNILKENEYFKYKYRKEKIKIALC